MSNTLHSMEGLSAKKQARFGKEQCQKMLKGRKEPSIYIEFLMTFGGVYVKDRIPKRSNFCTMVAKGNRMCDLITTNMEALMRTVLLLDAQRTGQGIWKARSTTSGWGRCRMVTRSKLMAMTTIMTTPLT